MAQPLRSRLICCQEQTLTPDVHHYVKGYAAGALLLICTAPLRQLMTTHLTQGANVQVAGSRMCYAGPVSAFHA